MIEERTVLIRRFRTGSVFRLVAAGCFFSLVPFTLLMGVLSLFGLRTINWNNAPVLGMKGFLFSPLLGVFIAAIFTAFGGVGMAFGLWIYSKIRPLKLQILEEPSPALDGRSIESRGQ
jgi:hypothetical protein